MEIILPEFERIESRGVVLPDEALDPQRRWTRDDLRRLLCATTSPQRRTSLSTEDVLRCLAFDTSCLPQKLSPPKAKESALEYAAMFMVMWGGELAMEIVSSSGTIDPHGKVGVLLRALYDSALCAFHALHPARPVLTVHDTGGLYYRKLKGHAHNMDPYIAAMPPGALDNLSRMATRSRKPSAISLVTTRSEYAGLSVNWMEPNFQGSTLREELDRIDREKRR